MGITCQSSVEIFNEHSWAFHVKHELYMLGFGELWINQHIDDKDLPVINDYYINHNN